MDPVNSVISPTLAPLHDLQANNDPKAAGEAFDGMFASMLIKQMRESLDEGLFGKDGGDVLGGLFDHFLGEHIAKAGGIGVGDMIRTQLELNNPGTRSS